MYNHVNKSDIEKAIQAGKMLGLPEEYINESIKEIWGVDPTKLNEEPKVSDVQKMKQEGWDKLCRLALFDQNGAKLTREDMGLLVGLVMLEQHPDWTVAQANDFIAGITESIRNHEMLADGRLEEYMQELNAELAKAFGNLGPSKSDNSLFGMFVKPVAGSEPSPCGQYDGCCDCDGCGEPEVKKTFELDLGPFDRGVEVVAEKASEAKDYIGALLGEFFGTREN